ncbi:hypothetical protein D3C84_630370 [compost metagenome]
MRKLSQHLPRLTILSNKPTRLMGATTEIINRASQRLQMEEVPENNLGVNQDLAAQAVAPLKAILPQLTLAANIVLVTVSGSRRNTARNTKNNGIDVYFPMFGNGKRNLQTLVFWTVPPSTIWRSRSWLARPYVPMKRSAVACQSKWHKRILDTTLSASTPLLAKTGLSK